MRTWIAIAVFGVAALVAAPAAAQQVTAGAGGGGGGGGGEKGTTTYNFQDDLVTGDLVRPDGEMLSVRTGGARSSLIQIREHFIPEMLESVEDL